MHGASKQAGNNASPVAAADGSGQMGEGRVSQGSDMSPNNNDAINQMSNAPPGTDPSPTLNNTAEINQQAEPTQTNGKSELWRELDFFFVLFKLIDQS